MTTDLVKLDGATALPTGATFSAAITLADWRRIGSALADMDEALPWWRGDWFNAGVRFTDLKEDQFHTEDEEANAVSHLLQKVTVNGKSRTVWNYAFVCRRIPLSRRVAELSFSHHSEVAAMKPAEQNRWLKKAVENEWTVADLRAAIGGRDTEPRNPGVFVPRKAVTDLVRWLRVQFDETPVEEWPANKRSALKRELQPLAELISTL